MKKLVSIITVCLMVVLLAFAVYAAESTVSNVTMNGQTDVSLSVLDDLSTAPAEALVVAYGNGATMVGVDTSLGRGYKMTVAGDTGVIVGRHKQTVGSWWAPYVGKGLTVATEAIAFRVTAENEILFGFEPYFISDTDLDGNGVDAFMSMTGDEDVILITAAGEATEAIVEWSAWNHAVVKLPKNFDGFIIVPTSRMTEINAYNSTGTWGVEGSQLEKVTNIWQINYFLQNYGTGGLPSLTVHDVYFTNNALPAVPSITAAPTVVPTPAPKSWITDMEVIGEGLVKVTVDDLIENTAWSEIAIFTEEKEITANSVIYQSKLNRNNNYSLWSGKKYGNIGSGTTGDFVFDFVDGTTYYVYITSCNGSAWTPCTVPYVFTYTAPQPTPGPTNTEPVPGPTNTEPVPGPTNTEPVPGPTNTEPVPGPTNTEPVPGPTNTEPVPAPESWIKDMEVAGEGVVDIKINIPDGTWWSEVSIFTHEPPDPRTIIDNKLDRGARNAVITGNWEGTIGPNNTDYDLPFAFVDGTTYYVYVSRCVNPYGSTVDEVWDVNPVAYRFTYEAPAPTEETWITDATVVDEGLVNLTFGNLGDDTSWSEIAIFTEDKGALDFNTIYASALSRPGNHSVWGGHKEGTVGSNGQFAFELVDGTTYYVYVVRNVGGVWDDDHLIKPFSFTYNAPQATPEPTPVPTPTVIPDDGDNGTADISVVLYAITALAGAGAVVAIKRKKA